MQRLTSEQPINFCAIDGNAVPLLSGSKEQKKIFQHFSITQALSSAASIQMGVSKIFAEVYAWANAVFCTRLSLQRNATSTATKIQFPTLFGSLCFDRKLIGTGMEKNNSKLVGSLSMSMRQLSFCVIFSNFSKHFNRIPMAQRPATACLHMLGHAASRYAAQDCPCLQFHGTRKGI